MKSLSPLLIGLLLSGVISAALCEEVAQPLKIPGIENAFRVTEKIYSGSQPEGDAAFAELEKLGVKTIVSVDGVRPDLAAARQHGLHYVHLPFGYDGVPTNRVSELAKLSLNTNGLIFVHCHHGQHRGPTAVAVMCLASETWPTNRAEAWLRQAGTAEDYPGLYRAVREFKMPTPAQLSAVKKLPEVAPAASLVDAMVTMDEHFEQLKISQKAGWKIRPEISPLEEATLLWEQLREIARTEDTAARPKDYRAKLKQAESSSENLRRNLKKPIDALALDDALQQTSQSCVACHKKYRN